MKYESVRLTNTSGKMWHIGADSHYVADNVILRGDPARCEMVAEKFDSSELKAVARGNPLYTGRHQSVDISVMSTGMGGTAVAICVEELKHTGARNLIRMGTCGSLQRDIPEGSIVICTGAVRGDGASPQRAPVADARLTLPGAGRGSGRGPCRRHGLQIRAQATAAKRPGAGGRNAGHRARSP